MAEPGKQSFVELMAEPAKQSFVELMEQQPLYGPLMDKPVQYKLIAVHNGTYWSLAIKGDQPDQDLPYVTIELISDDGINVVRAVRKVDYEEDELLRLLKAKDVGTYGPDKKLRDLCKIADDTFQGIVKWHEFCPQLVNTLGFQVDFDTTTSTYYTIEVFEGNGYKKCYLGTPNNEMWYGPTFPFGNLAVHWNCRNEKTLSSKVINLVTEQSPDPTFMQLGPQISSRPQTYQVTLSGAGQDFRFINSPGPDGIFDVYAIATMRDGNMMYLEPQDGNTGQIVAVVKPDKPFIFRVTPATPPIPPTLKARL